MTNVKTLWFDHHMTNTLKVSIPITVEIDIEAWADEYGAGSTAEIRADIKRHIQNTVRAQLDSLGVSA